MNIWNKLTRVKDALRVFPVRCWTLLRRPACFHEFNFYDIKLTNIPMPPEPERTDYRGWEKYYSNFYKCEAITKRVEWKCCKCGNVFYAHCGLDITPKYGRMVVRGAASGI
jgi:hypothetical protein